MTISIKCWSSRVWGYTVFRTLRQQTLQYAYQHIVILFHPWYVFNDIMQYMNACWIYLMLLYVIRYRVTSHIAFRKSCWGLVKSKYRKVVMCMCMFACMYVSMYVCDCVYVCTYVCLWLCVCVYVCMYLCANMNIYSVLVVMVTITCLAGRSNREECRWWSEIILFSTG